MDPYLFTPVVVRVDGAIGSSGARRNFFRRRNNEALCIGFIIFSTHFLFMLFFHAVSPEKHPPMCEIKNICKIDHGSNYAQG